MPATSDERESSSPDSLPKPPTASPQASTRNHPRRDADDEDKADHDQRQRHPGHHAHAQPARREAAQDDVVLALEVPVEPYAEDEQGGGEEGRAEGFADVVEMEEGGCGGGDGWVFGCGGAGGAGGGDGW